MRPLDAPLGRRRVGANAVDVELVQRPRKLCVAGALVRAGMIYSENAGLVAVERQWLAVFGGLLRIMYTNSSCDTHRGKPLSSDIVSPIGCQVILSHVS